MGAYSINVRIQQEPDNKTLIRELNLRTGLIWTANDETLSDKTLQTILAVPSFKWDVEVARVPTMELMNIESVLLKWPAIDYHFWQVLAVYAQLGAVGVSRNGDTHEIRLPKWIHRKWQELHWWQRYPG